MEIKAESLCKQFFNQIKLKITLLQKIRKQKCEKQNNHLLETRSDKESNKRRATDTQGNTRD